jgi:hypothetical protein
MSIHCDVILQCDANPEQLRAVGAALWRWCNGGVEAAGPYQSLNNQALADLIDGKLPVACQGRRHTEHRGFRLRVRDETSRNRREAIAGLRRQLPAAGIDDVVIDGVSWNRIDGPRDAAFGLAPGSGPVATPKPEENVR